MQSFYGDLIHFMMASMYGTELSSLQLSFHYLMEMSFFTMQWTASSSIRFLSLTGSHSGQV